MSGCWAARQGSMASPARCPLRPMQGYNSELHLQDGREVLPTKRTRWRQQLSESPGSPTPKEHQTSALRERTGPRH